MRKNIGALLAFAMVGISFAMPGMMGRTGRMGSAAAGGGFPLLEVGIGLVILAALIWWFDLRKAKADVRG